MEIATGYFAKARSYAEAGYTLVSIAKVSPWFLPPDLELYELPCLAPSQSILDLKGKPEEYEKRYRSEVLDKLPQMEVYQELYRIANESHSYKIVLMCYESPEKFCHRHIVAKWMAEAYGCNVQELQPNRLRDSVMCESDV